MEECRDYFIPIMLPKDVQKNKREEWLKHKETQQHTPPSPPPIFSLLYPYQQDHLQKIKCIHDKNWFSIDTSEMGTGKTFVSLAYGHSYFRQIIVLCLASLRSKWKKVNDEYFMMSKEIDTVPLHVFSYNSLLCNRTFTYIRDHIASKKTLVVLDEFHYIRNSSGMISRQSSDLCSYIFHMYDGERDGNRNTTDSPRMLFLSGTMMDRTILGFHYSRLLKMVMSSEGRRTRITKEEILDYARQWVDQDDFDCIDGVIWDERCENFVRKEDSDDSGTVCKPEDVSNPDPDQEEDDSEDEDACLHPAADPKRDDVLYTVSIYKYMGRLSTNNFNMEDPYYQSMVNIGIRHLGNSMEHQHPHPHPQKKKNVVYNYYALGYYDLVSQTRKVGGDGSESASSIIPYQDGFRPCHLILYPRTIDHGLQDVSGETERCLWKEANLRMELYNHLMEPPTQDGHMKRGSFWNTYLHQLEYVKVPYIILLSMYYLQHSPHCKLVIGLNYNDCIQEVVDFLRDFIEKDLQQTNPIEPSMSASATTTTRRRRGRPPKNLCKYDHGSVVELRGNMLDHQRDRSISSFSEPTTACRVMVGNLRVLSCGIDLDDCDGRFPRICLISPNYNALDLIQFMYRARRANSRSKPTIHLLYLAGCFFDQHLRNNLIDKSEVMSDVNPERVYPEDYPVIHARSDYHTPKAIKAYHNKLRTDPGFKDMYYDDDLKKGVQETMSRESGCMERVERTWHHLHIREKKLRKRKREQEQEQRTQQKKKKRKTTATTKNAIPSSSPSPSSITEHPSNLTT